MKYLPLLIILILSSCNDNKGKVNNNVISSNLKKASISNKKKYKVNLKELKYDLSMYNNKYLLKIVPDSSSSQMNMMYQILLIMKSDTIINHPINIDTIALKSKKAELKKNYYLSGIFNGFARAQYLRLPANLNSKKDTTNMNITIQFEYIGSETGKLVIF